MKDPILKYIEENREGLDSKIPSNTNWEKIENELNGKKRNKYVLYYASGIAAVLLIGLFIVNPFEGENEMVDNLEIIDNLTDSLIGIDRIDDVEYQINEYSQENQEEYKLKDVPHRVFVPLDGAVKFDNLNVTYNVSVKDVQGSSYQYSSDMAFSSDEEELSLYADGTKPLPGSNGAYPQNQRHKDFDLGYYNTQQQQMVVRHEVDRYYEHYEEFKENPFDTPLDKPLSTFGIDVDGAGYSNVRRFIQGGYLPPKNAVKLEEMVNYFDYNLPEPKGEDPFSITTEVGKCPWKKEHLLLQVALKGEEIKMDENQTNNLVFLIDVSGSMDSYDKLPLLKKSLYLMVDQMGSDDRIALVVYSGSSGLVLPSTSGRNKSKIYDAIENLSAGGSTAGGAGIELAYKVVNESKVKGGNNRVILATDGDFNVGISSDEGLVELIEEKRKSGVFLSVLGFGTGNLQSDKMEKLADNGNGNYYYIDNLLEAKKVLVDELGGTLITIAKDVKLQIEFNPEHVKNYRLLGYENRMLRPQDFNDDTKDAGDLGSGHTVVALYEIEPTDSRTVQSASNLRYQKNVVNTSKGLKDELALIKFRYKKPNSSTSRLIEKVVSNVKTERLSKNFYFSSAVAEFGMMLRNSEYKGTANFESILKRARLNKGIDEMGYRAEFIQIVERAHLLFREYQLNSRNK